MVDFHKGHSFRSLDKYFTGNMQFIDPDFDNDNNLPIHIIPQLNSDIETYSAIGIDYEA